MTPPEPASIVETHSAVVVFFGDRAFKVKKPVDLGFLDFRSRAAREAVCHREVELNRRLAPDVYLGVSDVLDPDGVVCDHLVVMRRMPAERRLSHLARGRRSTSTGRSSRSPTRWPPSTADPSEQHAADAAATADATRARWRANTPSLLEHAPDIVDASTVEAVQSARRSRTSTVVVGSSSSGSPTGGPSTATATSSPTTSSASTTGPASSTASSSTTRSASATACPTRRSSPWTSSTSAGPTWPSGSSMRTGRRRPTSGLSSLEHHHVAYRAQVRAKVAAIRAAQGDVAQRRASPGVTSNRLTPT